MSDGPSACARLAYSRAVEFARQKYPGAKEVHDREHPNGRGVCFCAEEDWLDHVLTIFRNGRAIHRFKVPPYGKIVVETSGDRHPKMRHYCG